MHIITILAAILATAIIGCSKRPEAATLNRAVSANWEVTVVTNHGHTVVPSSPKDDPRVIAITSAYEYLLGLHRQNRIPGELKDVHGTVREIDFALPAPIPNEVRHPFSWTFYVVRDGQESFTHCYTVGRETKISGWQLQRAWRTDSEGNIVKEWSVK